MELTREEEGMLGGEAVRQALQQQIRVGALFGAGDFVGVRTVHVMADIEAVADPGLAFLEETARLGGQFRVPVPANSRSVDFALWWEVGQDEAHVLKERRLIDALTAIGALPCNTCIN